GGDYDNGLNGCGIKIAHTISTCTTLGDELYTAVIGLSRLDLKTFLCSWRKRLKAVLAGPNNILGRRYPTLAQAVTNQFPRIEVLYAYLRPPTSCSDVPDNHDPDLSSLAIWCEKYFSWASSQKLLDRFRSKVWSGICPLDVNAAIADHVVRNVSATSRPHILKINQETLGQGNPSRRPNIWGYTIQVEEQALAQAALFKLAPEHQKQFSNYIRKNFNMWIPRSILERALPSLVARFHRAKPMSVQPPLLPLLTPLSTSAGTQLNPILVESDNEAETGVDTSCTEETLPLLALIMPESKPSPSRKSRSPRKKTQVEQARFHTLKAITTANVEKYTSVKNTSKSYAGHIRRCKAFLAADIKKRREDGVVVCVLGIPTDELEKALKNPPNQYSAMVVEMFISEKCFNEKLKKGVAEGIHAAFCWYWDNMDGDKYAGEYKFDKETKTVTGCPARASCVLDIKKAVQNRGKTDSATREHAKAMTIEDMTKLMQYSQMLCSDARLDNLRSVPLPGGENRVFDVLEEKYIPLTVDALLFVFEHGFMRAFSSSGFTLWTRCFELLSLTFDDLKLNCLGRAPYYMPHFKVKLENRKGWQNAQGYDGPRTSNIYEIYSQNITEIDMQSHLLRWIRVLENLLGRPLEPADQIFPHISVNGTIYARQEMSYDSFSKLLSKFSSGAQLDGPYTTHSYRRGGAQYRFVFAPYGTRWSLNKVRWWGGWAEGENVDTLMKYLFDSLMSFETGHGDALHPIVNGYNDSFMGEAMDTAPVTAAEVRELKRSVDEKIMSIDINLDTKLENLANRITTAVTSAHLVATTSLTPQTPCVSQTTSHHVVVGTQVAVFPHLPQSQSQEHVPAKSTLEISPSETDGTHIENEKGCRPVPIQGVCIPRLQAGPDAWKSAIRQWEEGEPESGLIIPLKDWPASWYTGKMRTFMGSKRREREIIVLAYNLVDRNEDKFLQTYPEASKSIRSLLKRIHRDPRISKQRTSKNGTP
ncbi:hypothetical protein H0H93_006101, partial [Arthromyces matolae]